MKNNLFVFLTLALLATLNPQLSTLHAQGTAFTYQGRLTDAGSPANGLYDLTFALFDAGSGGSQLGSTLTSSAMGVTNGVFTIALDFGANFPGAERWLEIAARTNGNGDFITLSPRQKFTPTPYAITASNLMGTVSATGLSGTYSSALTFSNAANHFSGDGAGLTSLNASNLSSGTVPSAALGNAWKTSGNSGTTPGAHFLGTTDNQPLEFKVNGLRALRLEDNGDSIFDPNTIRNGAPNVIGGSPCNFVAAGVVGATIAGGGATNYFGFPSTNSIAANFGVIGGGYQNTIQTNAQVTTIGGGEGNTIQTGAGLSTIGGGYQNTIQTNAAVSTIGGGENNTIQIGANNSTIGGGYRNTSSGRYATVPGGQQNVAGTNSLAAGTRAKAAHTGSFVWADSTDTDFATTAEQQFLIRATGGVGIGTATPATALEVNGTITATTFTGNGAGLTNLINLDAANLTGTLGTSQIPSLDASKITSGAFATSQIPSLDALKINSGTLNDARLSANVALLDHTNIFSRVIKSTANANSGSVGIGERWRDNAIAAWARVTSSGGIINTAFGVSAATNNSAGVYTLTLDGTFVAVTTLIPIAVAQLDSSPTSAATARVVTVNQLSTTEFQVFINNGNWAPTNNQFVFIVTGR